MSIQPHQPGRITTFNYTPPPKYQEWESDGTDTRVATWFAVVGSILIVVVMNLISWLIYNSNILQDAEYKCSDLPAYSEANCQQPMPHLWTYIFWMVLGWCVLMAWFLWRHRWYKRHPRAAAIMTGVTAAYAGYKLYEHHEQRQADRIGQAVADRIDLSGWDRR